MSESQFEIRGTAPVSPTRRGEARSMPRARAVADLQSGAERPETSGDLVAPRAGRLLGQCFDGVASFVERRTEVLSALDDLSGIGDQDVAQSARRFRKPLEALSPSITFIGQVKAGKTSLVNAMIGAPGLLPADVNPWTSVVTSLHAGPQVANAEHRAAFTFFDREDWDRLTLRGGRVGELAGRAGAEDEAEKVRQQIEYMKEKTRARLGRRFELLLGQRHGYGYFDQDLIERYVCLGDDFDTDLSGPGAQGRFADITKSADLWLDRPDWPMGLTLRDTPGVNDTFMMREQITIRAIRDSRLCVVVLSAHQALSSVDLALIRLISNVNSREVVIFVNRIDELQNPTAQIAEIRKSIVATLEKHNGPKDVKIVFGSAGWASAALQGDIDALPEDGSAALLDYAESALPDNYEGAGPEDMVWELSGIPALYRVLMDRICDGAAQEVLQTAARNAVNLATALKVSRSAGIVDLAATSGVPLNRTEIAMEIDRLEAAGLRDLHARFNGVAEAFAQRTDRAHKSFLDRATGALIKHLETFGELAPWSYDPAGLRLLLRSGHQVFARDARAACAHVFEQAAEAIADLYADALSHDPGQVTVAAPLVPRLAPPVLLGQTIALDLQSTWWRRWWQRRRGYQAFAGDFAKMIAAETAPIIEGLKQTHCVAARDDMIAVLQAFFADQRIMLDQIGRQGSDGAAATASMELDRTLTTLTRLAA